MGKTMTTKRATFSNRLGLGFLLTLLLTLAPAAWAISLQDAKQQGLVGEQRDGYIGLVVSTTNAEVSQLIAEVNRERLARYEQIARENGISLEQVQALAAKQAFEATQSGHFVQDANGRWQKK